VDITPHSLGIKCLDEYSGFPGFPFRFAPIVHRTTPLPASRSEVFTTVYDKQSEVEIEVYQGESEDVRHDHRIGNFRIQGLAPVPAGNQLVVQLDLNLDGMLKVSAREKATGLQKQITIENALARYELEERDTARQRLDQLWGAGPEEDEDEEMEALDTGSELPIPELTPGPREGQREAVQARALLEKAERLLERVQPEDRAEVERLLERVRTSLTDRQWDKMKTASNELADILFYIEDA
jgi:molecular chaperone DnaK